MSMSTALKTLIFTALLTAGCAMQQVKQPQLIDISGIVNVEGQEMAVITLKESDYIHVSKEDLACMQANLYFEAGNQKTDSAMAAVGYTVLNRKERKNYPNSVCGVVKQWKFRKNGRKVCQFSWFCDSKSDVPKLTQTVYLTQKVNGKLKRVKKTVPNKAEIEAWERAGRIAKAVLYRKIDNPVGSATMYHATYVRPGWDWHKLNKVATIETHIFYTLKG